MPELRVRGTARVVSITIKALTIGELRNVVTPPRGAEENVIQEVRTVPL